MARRQITREMYTALVDAFREVPGNAAAAGKAAGVDRRTAKRAYELGWPALHLIPVRQYLDDEQVRIRAAMQQEEQAKLKSDSQAGQAASDRLKEEADQAKAREQAKQDAISIGLDEVKVVRATQTNAKAAAAVANTILQSAFRVFAAHKTMIEQLPAKELAEKLKDAAFVEEMRKHARAAAYCANAAAQVSRITMEMERMRVGKPVAVIGVEVTDMTTAQVLQELEAARRQLEDAAAAGLDEPEVKPLPMITPETLQ